MITQATIDKIRQAADVVEVVGDFVQLKRKGKDYTACCPFHQEKTPSFYVSGAKNIYKCFGCGKAGDSVRFIMDLEGMTYPEALRWLAQKYHIEVEETAATGSADSKEQSERESLLIALQYAAKYYQQQLRETTEGRSIAMSYFRERGLLDPAITTFGLGWAPEARDHFWQAARREGYDKDLLIKAGLIVEKDGNIIDRFRARVMFPIHNAAGKVIAFGGRTLSKEKTIAKYINSPETPVYNKSQVLYGLFQGRQALRQEDNCYMTEGYMDVIAMHQAGFTNVVASSGTSLTEDQIRLVKRYTPNVTVLYDGDSAGIKASLRGIDMLLAQGMNVWALTLPNGEDPDSYLRKAGSEALRQQLGNRQNFIGFKAALLTAEAAGDPVARVNMVRDLVTSITKVPDAIARSVFYKEVAQLTGVAEEVLIREGNKLLQADQRKSGGPAQPDAGHGAAPAHPGEPDYWEAGGPPEDFSLPEDNPQLADPYQRGMLIAEREHLRLLLQYATTKLDEEETLFAHAIIAELEGVQFETPIYARLLDMYRHELEKGIIPQPSWFTSNEDPVIASEAANLLLNRHTLSENWETKHNIFVAKEEAILTEIANETLMRLHYKLTKRQIDQNLQAWSQTKGNPDADAACLQVHMELKQRLQVIASHLRIVVG